ncbi:MAG: hypothetical protein KAR13_07375, partial [Desulfobulbaceae bacterium]|nr:hypothetical protein [Desulfobulbaceae bacterium]
MMLYKNKKLRYIFLTSLLLAVIMPLLKNYVIYPRHRHHLIMHTEDNAIRVARHVARHMTDKKENFDKDFIKQWGKENGKYVIEDFNLMKITIFAPSGEIIHSSSPEDIGKVNSDSYFHETVTKGEVVTEVIEKENKTPEGEVIKSNVTETYVPITKNAELLGVFEICYDITHPLNDLKKTFSTLLIYLIFFIFLSLIFTILIRLDRQMLKQKTTTELLETKQNNLLVKQKKQSLLFKKIERAKRQWEITMDCINDIVILTDVSLRIQRCNKAIRNFAGTNYSDLLGKKLTDITDVIDFKSDASEYYHKPSGRWFDLNLYSLKDTNSESDGFVITLHDLTEIKKISSELEKKHNELHKAYSELKQTQSQLLQHEKMACIGQLAAGVAHEINNPAGYVLSNLGSLGKYVTKLTEFIEFQVEIIEQRHDAEAAGQLSEQRKKINLDFILKDIKELIQESLEGCEQVRKIVQDLKGFSRVDQAEKQYANINECLESTLNIVWNELKYKAKVEKDYGDVKPVECFPQQLNQVFMNLLVNAAHAIEKKGTISIKTR